MICRNVMSLMLKDILMANVEHSLYLLLQSGTNTDL